MAIKQISRENSMNCDKTDLSPHLSCEEISPHDRFFSIFLHIYHVESFLQLTICHLENFSTWQSVFWRNFLHRHRLWCLWQISGMGSKREVILPNIEHRNLFHLICCFSFTVLSVTSHFNLLLFISIHHHANFICFNLFLGHYFGWILKVESERLYCQILSTGIYWIVGWSPRPEIITALIRNWLQKRPITKQGTQNHQYFWTAKFLDFLSDKGLVKAQTLGNFFALLS